MAARAASQPTRTSGRATRQVDRFRFDGSSQPVGVRAVSPPPSPVRLEIVGIGEEEAIVELEELVQGGEEDGVAGADFLEQEDEEHVEEGLRVEEPVGGEALLHPVGRRVRGADAEQGDVVSRLDPVVPGPIDGNPLLDADGWREIDRLGAWDCALNTFLLWRRCPLHLGLGGGRR